MGTLRRLRPRQRFLAEIARVLDIPIVLVVDARSAARLHGALSGFIGFRPDVRVAGVIFNKVGSDVTTACCNRCALMSASCLGYLPKTDMLKQDSRYLGLDFSKATETRQLVQFLEQHVDWRSSAASPFPDTQCAARLPQQQDLSPSTAERVVIARNVESFSFLYQGVSGPAPPCPFFDPERDGTRP